MTRLSEKYNERTYFAMLQNVWTLPCLIALRFWPGVITNAWGTYALIILLLAYPYCRTHSHLPCHLSSLTDPLLQTQSTAPGFPKTPTTSAPELSRQPCTT